MSNLMKKTNKETQIGNTHVPDKVYAYSLQIRHALYELLNCHDDDIVSIEVLDDIAVEKSNNTVRVTQIKNVSSDRNPVSDRAPDLWKTFYNWLIAIQADELKIDNAIFRLFIAADKNGSIVSLFHEADTLESATNAWKEARLEFYDDKGKEKTLGSEYATYIRKFFDLKNISSSSEIIQKFKLVTIEQAHTQVIFNEFCQKTMIHEDLLSNAFVYMLGWIDKRMAELFEAKEPMRISYRDYKAELIAITQELNQRLSLVELAPPPTDEQVKNEYGELRTYLEQLDIIDCDYTEKIEAINDFIRASTNRVMWAKRGDVSEVSLNSFSDDLMRRWNTQKEIIKLREKGLLPKEKGRLLYLECKVFKIDINHLCVPSFFIPGCYHALSDKLIIGWHPDYKEILNGGKTDE